MPIKARRRFPKPDAHSKWSWHRLGATANRCQPKVFASKPLSFETTASNFANPSVVAGRRADDARRLDLDLKSE